MNLYIITATGSLISTEVRATKSYSKAKDIMADLFRDYKLDGTEADEMSRDCWMGYSKSAKCDVVIELHYIIVDE